MGAFTVSREVSGGIHEQPVVRGLLQGQAVV
jgi:hypothetical protein